MAGEVCASGFFSTSAAFSAFFASLVTTTVDCATASTSGFAFESAVLLEVDSMLFFGESSSALTEFSCFFSSAIFFADVSSVLVF